MIGDEVPSLLPARMLNEFVYCPRLFYLEWVQGDFKDSADVIEGRTKHKHVNVEGGKLSAPEELATDGDIQFKTRSLTLACEKYGIIARMDLVEVAGGKVSPVEYKKGKEPNQEEKVWPSDLVQISAQILILRENGYKCETGFLYYSESKKRVKVEISEEIVRWTQEEIEKARELSNSRTIPPPLADSPRCVRCSLASICLPDEVISLSGLSPGNVEGGEVRRLYPARDDSLPVYVQEQGASVSKRNEELIIRFEGEIRSTVRLIEVSQLSLFGNVQVSTQMINELCRRNIPICYFTTGGWFNGLTHGMAHKNVELRIRQYSAAGDKEMSLSLAKKFVEGKIKNSRTLLRRNSDNSSREALDLLQHLTVDVSKSRTSEELLGIEGLAGRTYFQHFGDMIKENTPGFHFDFEGRNRRPPRDAINALLSYVYALLTKEFTVTTLAVGLDPFLGFYHKPRYGRPSLALDLMEEFRPIVADSVVISLVNNREVAMKDFIQRGPATSLTSEAKKKVIGAYERRMDSLISHPMFGYSVSYRRILEVQARLLSRYLSKELREYPIFSTR
jgi:CRISPR-associated protein Cas1